jgi:thioredoxin reductase (NADPH)
MTEKPNYSDVPRPLSHSEIPPIAAEGTDREIIIVGGGLAGLSAAIYLGRALRDVLVIDAGDSLALWEPEVQNYLGFPEGIDGRELLKKGREQAARYGAEFVTEEITNAWVAEGNFHLIGKKSEFRGVRVLLATGVYHLPPKIPAVNECVGKSLFFCKDCDGYRVQGKRVGIVGATDEAAEYALGILAYTDSVALLANGERPAWDGQHADWLKEYDIPVILQRIIEVMHCEGKVQELRFESGKGLPLDYLFTVRGDVYHNSLARQLGAEVDAEGQVVVDHCQRTTVKGLYAAGCVTPANCQMIIAAGHGAAAAQAINRDLFEQSLSSGAPVG